MTVVRVRVDVPADGGDVPAAGSLAWKPTAPRVRPGVGAEADSLVLPSAFVTELVEGAADVEVDPTTDSWVWSVVESFAGVPVRRRYFAVPDVASVDYTDLVAIDPLSLLPAPSADPAWLASFESLSAGVVTADPDNPGFYLIGA
jgi:hypothetical protein